MKAKYRYGLGLVFLAIVAAVLGYYGTPWSTIVYPVVAIAIGIAVMVLLDRYRDSRR